MTAGVAVPAIASTSPPVPKVLMFFPFLAGGAVGITPYALDGQFVLQVCSSGKRASELASLCTSQPVSCAAARGSRA